MTIAAAPGLAARPRPTSAGVERGCPRRCRSPSRRRGRARRRRRCWRPRGSPRRTPWPARVDLLGRAHLLDLALGDHGDLVAHRERLLLVVGDVHERDADLALHGAQLQLEVLAQLGVEGAERLVEQQHLRAQHECPRQGDALLLAAGQLGGRRFAELARSGRARAPRRPASWSPPWHAFW